MMSKLPYLADTAVADEAVGGVARNAAAAPAVDLDVPLKGLGVAAKIGLEQRLLKDDVGGRVHHV